MCYTPNSLGIHGTVYSFQIIKSPVDLGDLSLCSCFSLVEVESLTFGFRRVSLNLLVFRCGESPAMFFGYTRGHPVTSWLEGIL